MDSKATGTETAEAKPAQVNAQPPAAVIAAKETRAALLIFASVIDRASALAIGA